MHSSFLTGVRRSLPRILTGGLMTLSIGILIGGCGGPGGADSGETGSRSEAGNTSANKLNVVAFKGGFGIDFYQQVAEEYAKDNPGLEVNVTGDPRVWEKLRPQFVGGTPPDLVFPGWGMDHWALAEEDQLLDLSKALKEKAEGSETPWGDTFEPSLLKLGQLDGKQFVLPYFVSVMGWWYDPDLFKKNGWTPPKNWEELLVLGEKIKATKVNGKAIAPLTYQGQYPEYMIDGMLLPWTMAIGGPDAIRAMQNLEPGSWNSPSILEAAKRIVELQNRGFFQSGATAMSHTEAQQEFIQGKAAMIPCGSWLYSEMKPNLKPGAKMEYMLPPTIPGGKGDPSSLIVKIEPWMIASKAKNQKGAIGLFKRMTSLENAKKFVREKGTLMAIKGSSDTELPENLVGPAKAFGASANPWAVQFRAFYPSFKIETENALTSLLTGQLTPQEFVDRLEAAAEKTRKDPNITKRKI